jgi:(p)ppGpp synthase/HD superfamily hydrolase
LAEIQEKFGDEVAAIVRECSDTVETPKPPWRERKESYLRHLKDADAETRLVSAADKLNNVRSILSDHREFGEVIWQRFNGGREGTLWYYRSLVQEFERGEPNRLVRELGLGVGELEMLAKIKTASVASESGSFEEVK